MNHLNEKNQIVAVALSQVGNVGGEPFFGHGTVSAAVWSGAPVSSAGVLISAAISTPVSFRSLQAVSTTSSGSGSAGSGQITLWRPRPA